MPAFYSPTTGEKRFTHYPRGLLDGTDDEYEFDDACDDESVASCRRDCDSDDNEDTFLPDETETIVPNEAEPISTKKKETPFELLKRLEEEESEDEEFNRMLETPIFAKVATKLSAELNKEKENMIPDLIQVKTEIDDIDKKPAAKTKEQLDAEKKKEWKKEEIDNDLFDEHLQKLLDDHLGEVRRPFKMVDLKCDLKWKIKNKKVKKEVKRRKKKNRQASKQVDEPPIKKRKLTAQEKQDQAYAHSLHIQELLRMTRGSL